MKYFYCDILSPMTETFQRHIIEPLDGGGFRSWPLNDENPNKPGLDAWLAEGNTITEWTPEP